MKSKDRDGWRRAPALARRLLLLLPFATWAALGAAPDDDSELAPDDGYTQREEWCDPAASFDADYGLYHDTDYLDGYDERAPRGGGRRRG